MRKTFWRLVIDIGIYQNVLSIYRHVGFGPGYYERSYRYTPERAARLIELLKRYTEGGEA